MRFGLCVSLISLLLSLVALWWVKLPWWMVFRRCVSIAAALSLWLFIRKFERRSFRSYGLSAGGAGKHQLLSGLFLGLWGLGTPLGIGLASGVCRIHITADSVRLWWTVLGFVPLACLISILEELVFRGFILQHLMLWSRPTGFIISSVLYSIVHLKITTLNLSTGLELGGLFLLGGVLALTYLQTNQLYQAIGLHATLAYGARVNKLFLEFPDHSISWLIGTNRLVNGLAGWVVLLGIGAMVVWWAQISRRGGVHDA